MVNWNLMKNLLIFVFWIFFYGMISRNTVCETQQYIHYNLHMLLAALAALQ